MRQRTLLLILLVAAVGTFFALDLDQYLKLEALRARQAELQAFRSANPVQAAGAFFLLYVTATGLSLPGATILTLAGGAIFGLWWGTLLISFASTLGATLAFLAARFLLRDFVRTRFGERLGAIDAGMRKDGTLYLFTLRLVPIFPFFIINLLMGLTGMRPATFYGVSQLGMLPGTLVYVNAGTQLAQIRSTGDILSLPLLASFALLGIFPLLARRAADWLRARRASARWTRPRSFERNLVVIGAGAGGLVASYIAATLRAKVTLVEQDRMGGDCLNTGCVPSKALIRSARQVALVRRNAEFGLHEVDVRADFAAVMQRVRAAIARIAPHDSAERYTGLGVEVITGRAQVLTPWEVEVSSAEGATRRLTTRSIVLATGARPIIPDIPGLGDRDGIDFFTSDTIWQLESLPPRLLVLGGGSVGCELAQAFARLGSQVTLVELAPRLLAREDAEVSATLETAFRAEGIRVLTGHRTSHIERSGETGTLVARHDGGESRLPFDTLLLALGRQPNVAGYGLEALGVLEDGKLPVDTSLRTRIPNIFAVGDLTAWRQLTHAAAHQAWYAAVNALFAPWYSVRMDGTVLPAVVFTDPEIARVGLSEQEARELGTAFETTRFDLAELDRAITDGCASGFVKVLTVPGRDRILGATIVGEHAGELIAEYALAMRQRIGLNRILGTVHAYPTWSEANKHAAGAWRRAHAPQAMLRWVERLHRWNRRSP
jgi:pyruvate/2-oxoglutarate dehydrogenase complex dihydrolipoamide dehydrogenase (E3) component/uncharacterized membrane protein YdjX (TVP38/TMEM64 family)